MADKTVGQEEDEKALEEAKRQWLMMDHPEGLSWERAERFFFFAGVKWGEEKQGRLASEVLKALLSDNDEE